MPYTKEEIQEMKEFFKIGQNPAQQPLQPKKVAPAKIDDPKDYIILPGRFSGNNSYPDTLVSTQRSHQNKNWYNAHEALQKENSFMLTIRQYVDFLSLLKFGEALYADGTPVRKEALEHILADIVEKKDPWRGEWLDAKFAAAKDSMNISYKHLLKNGQINPQVTEPLENCLTTNGYVDLDSATRQGLPTKKSSKRKFIFMRQEMVLSRGSTPFPSGSSSTSTSALSTRILRSGYGLQW